jgi:hypothetical protein
MVTAQAEPQKLSGISRNLFIVLLLLIVGGAIVRYAIATRLDGFTIDEAYHIAAGVSYVRYADFRINPEHPRLVKLWVGSLISATGFRLSGIRPFADKADERGSDPDLAVNRSNVGLPDERVKLWLLLTALTEGVASQPTA